jgi:protein involved in plasmid replication-relaxation
MSPLTSALMSNASSHDGDVYEQRNSAAEAPHPPQLLSSDGSPGHARPDSAGPRLVQRAHDGDAAPERIGRAHVEWVAARLTDRDWQIIQTVNTLRVATGTQLERLHFTTARVGRSRTVTRSRALRRLVNWQVLAPVGRRVGGRQRGSTVQVFALDRAGQRLLKTRQLADGQRARVRRPGAPRADGLAHLLAVTELYVELVEQTRGTALTLARFEAEPGAHWPNGQRGWLKPDAYVALARAGAVDHWWIEMDMATESLPTVKAKLQTYLDFHQRGGVGPGDLMPWVLVVAVTDRRRGALAAMAAKLPKAESLVTVVTAREAARHMFEVLRE